MDLISARHFFRERTGRADVNTIADETQFVSVSAFSIAGFTMVLKPRLIKPRAEIFRISGARIHTSADLMHLFRSILMYGWRESTGID